MIHQSIADCAQLCLDPVFVSLYEDNMSPVLLWLFVFRYHEDRSKKLNACCSCISCMVYFYPEHRNLIIWRLYVTIFTCYFNASFNLTPCLLLPCVYLLGGPTSLLMMVNTHPPLSLVCQQLPHPLLALPPFHTPQFRLHYFHRRHRQLQSSSSGTVPWRLRHPPVGSLWHSDHTQTAQFDPLEVGLNVGCDNPTHVQSDPFSASPGRLEDSWGDDTQMALIKNGAAPPERTSPMHGSAVRKLDLT
jgi:hypothetical protein